MAKQVRKRRLLILPNHSVGVSTTELFLESAEADLIVQSAGAFQATSVAAFAEPPTNSSLTGRLSRAVTELHELNVLAHDNGLIAKIINYVYAALRMPFVVSRYDAIYIFSPGYCALIASACCLLLRREYGYYVRGTWLTDSGETSPWWKVFFSGSSFIIATGEAFRERLGQFNPRVVNEVPLTKLRPGWSSESECRTKGQRLMYAGRLTESKGVLDIVRAVARLRQSGYRDVHVTFAGGGLPSEFASIQEVARQLGVEECVTLAGHLSPESLGKLYRQSDVFVFPSYFAEGFPRVLYEAMMFGTPIVTTRMPGLEGFLIDGKNCVYCEPRNPVDVAKQVAKVLGDPDLASRIGATAIDDVKRVFDSFEHGSHAEQLVHFAA